MGSDNNERNVIDESSIIDIRKFTIDDYENLISLWQHAGLPYKPQGRDSYENIKAELIRGCCIFIIATKNGEIIGSCFGTHDGRKGWLNRLAVKPECRNSGIARRLVQEVEDRLNDLGIHIIACLVEDWNIESMKVFEKLGYKEFMGMKYYTKRKHTDI